jgi:hypothetical protein
MKYTKEQFIEYAIGIHGDKYVYDKVDYVNNKTNVTIICKLHGEFKQRPGHHLSGQGCVKCAKELRKHVKTVEFIRKAQNVHENKYIYTNTIYSTLDTPVKIICPIHGEFKQRPGDHLRGKGCRNCQYEHLSNMFRLSTEEFIKKARQVHGDIYNYDKVKYVNNRTAVLIQCPVHGEFKQRPDNHLCGKGCAKCYCGISKKANAWLDQFKNVKRERRVKAYNHTYIVDGIDKDTNTVYEFWGDFWHGNPQKYGSDEINSFTKTTFGTLYRNTQKKIKNLKKAGFKIVSIWECEWDDQVKEK